MYAPEPPVDLPPGRVVHVPGRGELFVRDTGGDGPAILLLHGWMFAADLNWWRVYGPLAERGFRVVALDHRGHGRGLRTPEPFTLAACAADAAALVAHLECGPVTAVGYSMGGPVAQLLARNHRESARAIVLCATAADWRDLQMRVFFRTMALLRLILGLFPIASWNALLRVSGAPDSPVRAWTAAELSRGSARDIAHAGRELGRYDARPWLGELTLPSAVVVTSRDRQVPPRKQRALAKALGATTHEVHADHLAVGTDPEDFMAALDSALDAVAPTGAPRVSAAA